MAVILWWVIANLEMQKQRAPLAPWQGNAVAPLLCSGLDQSRFLPAAVFADSHTLAPFGKLNEPRTFARGDDPLSGAARKAIQLAPIIE
jgi:hypothetical protein